MVLRHLDLFSGIGGFALAARWAGFETIGFCEIDKYSQKVLAKNCPGIDIHDDIKTFKADEFCGVGIITGGFPCAPVSTAGKRRFKNDDRWLWPEMFRVIGEAKPDWVIIENVAGVIKMGLQDVLFDLESRAGYKCQTFAIPAVSLGARHERSRIWVVANSDVTHRTPEWNNERMGWIREQTKKNGNEGFRKWPSFTGVRGRTNGLRNRMDRLRGLGQSICPQVAYEIMRCINLISKCPRKVDY